MRATDRTGRHRLALALALACGLPVLVSCTSSQSTAEALAVDSETSTLHRGSDGYPDFSAPLRAAMTQMTDEEARQMGEELAALDAGRRAGTITEGQYWARVRQLKALAQSHAADTIADIEAAKP